MPKLALV